MDDTTLITLAVAGGGVLTGIIVEWLHLRMLAWWDRRQIHDKALGKETVVTLSR